MMAERPIAERPVTTVPRGDCIAWAPMRHYAAPVVRREAARLWRAVRRLLDRQTRTVTLTGALAAWSGAVEVARKRRRDAFLDAMGEQMRAAKRCRIGLERHAWRHGPLRQMLATWRGEARLGRERRVWIQNADHTVQRSARHMAAMSAWRVLLAWHQAVQSSGAHRAKVTEVLDDRNAYRQDHRLVHKEVLYKRPSAEALEDRFCAAALERCATRVHESQCSSRDAANAWFSCKPSATSMSIDPLQSHTCQTYPLNSVFSVLSVPSREERGAAELCSADRVSSVLGSETHEGASVTDSVSNDEVDLVQTGQPMGSFNEGAAVKLLLDALKSEAADATQSGQAVGPLSTLEHVPTDMSGHADRLCGHDPEPNHISEAPAGCDRIAPGSVAGPPSMRNSFSRSLSVARMEKWGNVPAGTSATLPVAAIGRAVSVGGARETPRRDLSPRAASPARQSPQGRAEASPARLSPRGLSGRPEASSGRPRAASPPRCTAVPVSCATPRQLISQVREPSLPRGPERFFYDTKGYTGCARFGAGEAPPPVRRKTDSNFDAGRSPFPPTRRRSIR